MMFFDSYAILEIINRNKAFVRFADEKIITNTLHFAEVYYALLRLHNKKTAKYWADHLDFAFLDITKDICIEATDFRHEHKKQRLSYADCIGYVTAQKHSMPFVTGDKEFRRLKAVLFVK